MFSIFFWRLITWIITFKVITAEIHYSEFRPWLPLGGLILVCSHAIETKYISSRFKNVSSRHLETWREIPCHNENRDWEVPEISKVNSNKFSDVYGFSWISGGLWGSMGVYGCLGGSWVFMGVKCILGLADIKDMKLRAHFMVFG